MQIENYKLYLNDITVRNIRNFRDIEKYTLCGKGVTLVSGENGLGKSTFFSIIRLALFGSMQNKSKLEDLVRNSKDSYIELNFFVYGVPHTITLSKVKKKWTRSIIVNGVDNTPHNQSNFWSKVKEIIGMNSDEWDAAVHLSQGGSHVLATGKPSERKQYIEDFFGITGDFDSLEKASKAELNETLRKIKEIESFSSTRQLLLEELSMMSELPTSDMDSYKKKKDALLNRVSEIDIRLSELDRSKSKIDIYNQYKDLAYPDGYGEDSNAEYSMQYYLNEHTKAENSLKNYNSVVSYNENVKKVNEQITKLEDIVNQNLDFEIRFPEELDIYQKEIFSLESKKNESIKRKTIEESISKYSEYATEKYNPQQIDELTSLNKQINEKYSLLNHEYARISAGKCPTCGHEHKHTEVQTKYDELLKLYNELGSSNSELISAKSYYDNHQIYKKLLSDLSKIPDFNTNDSLRLDELNSVIDKLREYKSAKNQLKNSVKQELQHCSLPPSKEEIDQHKTSYEFFKNMYSYRQKCLKPSEILTIDYNPEEYNRLVEEKSDLKHQIDNCNAQILNAQEVLDRYNRLNSQYQEIEEKFSGLPLLKETEFFWETMVQAYGSNGLRVAHIQKVMDLIMNILPLYTSIMFDPRYSYEFSAPCDSNSIPIICKRFDSSTGEDPYEYDISTLSGGESKRIAVCIVFAVAKARMANKSVNIVILDEIDSQMDASGRSRFNSDLLPTIKDSFDSIFIVSHHEDSFQKDVYDRKMLFQRIGESHYTSIKDVNYAG